LRPVRGDGTGAKQQKHGSRKVQSHCGSIQFSWSVINGK
jgi:hypothetical protein